MTAAPGSPTPGNPLPGGPDPTGVPPPPLPPAVTAPPPAAPPPLAALPPPRKRRTWLVVLLSMVIFLSGMIVGGGLTVVIVIHQFRRALLHPEVAARRITDRLDHRLGLTRQESDQVFEIILHHQMALHRIHMGIRPQVDRELDQTEDDIAKVLTPDQARRWREMADSFRKEWLPPPPPGEEGPPPGQGPPRDHPRGPGPDMPNGQQGPGGPNGPPGLGNPPPQ